MAAGEQEKGSGRPCLQQKRCWGPERTHGAGEGLTVVPEQSQRSPAEVEQYANLPTSINCLIRRMLMRR